MGVGWEWVWVGKIFGCFLVVVFVCGVNCLIVSFVNFWGMRGAGEGIVYMECRRRPIVIIINLRISFYCL